MSRSDSLRSTAVILGVVALVTAGAGIALRFYDQGSGEATGGILIRVGAVLGSVALVLPHIRRPSSSLVLVTGLGLVLVLARPALVWVALVGWVGWLWRRQRRTDSSDS